MPGNLSATDSPRPLDKMITDGFSNTCLASTNSEGEVDQKHLLATCLAASGAIQQDMVEDLIVYLVFERDLPMRKIDWAIRSRARGFALRVNVARYRRTQTGAIPVTPGGAHGRERVVE